MTSDNEIDTISLGIVPGSISENGGTATGTVTRFVGDKILPPGREPLQQ